ncbi:MAG: GspE/PulE family protein [Elainellaceae cyanobacterium]
MANSSSQRRASSQRNALVVRQDFSPFGNKLVQAGYIDSEQMQQALVESRKSGRPLTDVLETLTGKNLPPDLLRQYKKQQLFELKILFGVESLDPELSEIPTTHVGQLIDGLIPVDTCRRYQLIPLSRNQTEPPSVLVAMVDPDDLAAQDDLNRILRPQGLALQRMVITPDDYQRLMSQYLDEKVEREKKIEQESRVDVRSDIEGLDYLDLEEAPDDMEANLDSALQDAEAAPIISLVNKMLIKALQGDVSDIHVEPQEDSLRVRYRKDGVLREAFEPLPKKIVPSVTARLKIMANLDIAERRIPQDGRIRRRFDSRVIDFRVSTIPSRYGEKVCLRILDNSSTQFGLDALITDPPTLQMVKEMVSRPFGLILVTGPTGSGKTTTLYSALAERNTPEVNINTVEDPIEYSLPGITQVQVIREKGIDFASILRSFLRQDPDVILVGETRDKETAKTAIEAALTGHLVMTTLHTNDAASAIARLDEMGVESFMLSGSLIGILAQRLVRRVCDKCRQPYSPNREELSRFGISDTVDLERTFYWANVLSVEQIQAAQESSELCSKCGGSGYKGRCGVYEVMRMNETIETLITDGAPTERIKEVATEEGMKTLLAYSLELVRQGMTTFEEVERVTLTDSGLEAELKARRKASLVCRVCEAALQPEWSQCPYCTTPRFHDG